jgi:hypothetical protein
MCSSAAVRHSGAIASAKAPADTPMARPISGGMTAPPSAEPGIRSCGPRPPLRSAQPLSEPAADASERSRTRTAAPRLSRYWGTPVGSAHRLPLRLSRHSAVVWSDPRARDPDVGHPLRCGRADGAVSRHSLRGFGIGRLSPRRRRVLPSRVIARRRRPRGPDHSRPELTSSVS